MEEVVASHSAVAECAVVGIENQLKGQIPVGFIVLKVGVDTPERDLEKELVQMVRHKVGPVGVLKGQLLHSVCPKPGQERFYEKSFEQLQMGKNSTHLPLLKILVFWTN